MRAVDPVSVDLSALGLAGTSGQKMLSVETHSMARTAGKFRSDATYHSFWSAAGWLVTIAVPEEAVKEPAQLRDQIQDILFIYYTR